MAKSEDGRPSYSNKILSISRNWAGTYQHRTEHHRGRSLIKRVGGSSLNRVKCFMFVDDHEIGRHALVFKVAQGDDVFIAVDGKGMPAFYCKPAGNGLAASSLFVCLFHPVVSGSQMILDRISALRHRVTVMIVSSRNTPTRCAFRGAWKRKWRDLWYFWTVYNHRKQTVFFILQELKQVMDVI